MQMASPVKIHCPSPVKAWPYVASSFAAGLFYYADELGYVQNHMAYALRKGRSMQQIEEHLMEWSWATVEIPRLRMGGKAAKLMLKRLKVPNMALQQIVLEPRSLS